MLLNPRFLPRREKPSPEHQVGSFGVFATFPVVVTKAHDSAATKPIRESSNSGTRYQL
jgi:hypothetical protein